MLNSKVKIIFGVYFCLLLVSGCCDSETFNVQITEIEFRPVNNFVAENENFEFNLNLTDSIVAKAWNNINLNIIQKAYAFKCDDEDTYRPIATVTEMKMKLLTDFSSEYQTNNFISELIDVRFYNWRTQKIETKSLKIFFDFLRQDNRATGRSAQLQNATYILTKRPTVSKEQQFELEFIFTDGSILTTTTETIIWE
jgi:hypothetical protein